MTHFRKHQFDPSGPYETPQEWVDAGQAFRSQAADGEFIVRSSVGADRVWIGDPETSQFGVYYQNGNLRTFYTKENGDMAEYMAEQGGIYINQAGESLKGWAEAAPGEAEALIEELPGLVP